MPDPSSESFQSRAGGLFALPAAGYKRRSPSFPLPKLVLWDVWKDEEGTHRERDESGSQIRNDREIEVWRQLWKLPQGFAWSRPQYKYLQVTLAQYVRQYVLCEQPEAKAADRTALCRFADTIGLTPQGLRINGWKIVVDEPKKRQSKSNDSKVIPFPSARERYADLED
jgi:hypothetical protein